MTIENAVKTLLLKGKEQKLTIFQIRKFLDNIFSIEQQTVILEELSQFFDRIDTDYIINAKGDGYITPIYNEYLRIKKIIIFKIELLNQNGYSIKLDLGTTSCSVVCNQIIFYIQIEEINNYFFLKIRTKSLVDSIISNIYWNDFFCEILVFSSSDFFEKIIDAHSIKI